MGGHGHGPPYTIPKASEYSIKGIPELEGLEKALALKGLKDPWIRNEAWRFSPAFGTKWMRARKLFFRGFPLGLGLAIATVAYSKMSGGDDHHGHGHEGH